MSARWCERPSIGAPRDLAVSPVPLPLLRGDRRAHVRESDTDTARSIQITIEIETASFGRRVSIPLRTVIRASATRDRCGPTTADIGRGVSLADP